MSMRYAPCEELYHRIKRFQEYLLNNDVDEALIVQKADLFYFSGTCQNAHLFIPAQGEPALMVRKSLKRAREESALDNITDLWDLDELLKTIAARLNGRGRIGLEQITYFDEVIQYR